MSTDTLKTEIADLSNSLQELSEAPLPEVSTDIVAYDSTDPSSKALIDQAMAEIDFGSTNSIIHFGTSAQEEVNDISERMLDGVRNKDTGPAGAALNDMLATLRGFNVDELNPNKKRGFFGWLFGKARPVAKFLQGYEDVRKQIDSVSNRLDQHKMTLLKDITSLDKLYHANLDYFHKLEHYIVAGEQKLEEADTMTIPALEKTAAETTDMLDAQKLRDFRSARDDLERRVHDLKLTRQVAMQSLPSIRMVQENDKGLVTKINSTMVNTIPLWKNQLAQAVTIYRSQQAGKTLKEATDLTNELLEANAENLKTANAEIRTQLERGVFDIESVKKANDDLIATIQESLQIADEGKRRRAEAEQELITAEAKLRETLVAAKAKATQAADAGASATS
ncbi:MAG: toxic anion resistance protein [Pseudomonadota bacterium]